MRRRGSTTRTTVPKSPAPACRAVAVEEVQRLLELPLVVGRVRLQHHGWRAEADRLGTE